MPFREDLSRFLLTLRGGSFTTHHWNLLEHRIEEWQRMTSPDGASPRILKLPGFHPLHILQSVLSEKTGLGEPLFINLMLANDEVKSAVFNKSLRWAEQSTKTMDVCLSLLHIANITRHTTQWDALDLSFSLPFRSSNSNVLLSRLLRVNQSDTHPERVAKFFGMDFNPRNAEGVQLFASIVKQGEMHLAKAVQAHLKPGAVLKYSLTHKAAKNFNTPNPDVIMNYIASFLASNTLDAWAISTKDNPSPTFDFDTRTSNCEQWTAWAQHWYVAASTGLLTEDYAHQLIRNVHRIIQPPVMESTFLPTL